ncbi:LysR family transcriptional regulator [Metapseudomonas lalkuanensis]|uniref:LysR family transcriptional regulator n=1 Tax=Metapseudomonas lalkuanensis TaxID=2604832 RepID=A0A5J6QIF0_9GAMM|nr:LysR substrate-binding domain-containing protein [Pseudomonas lalkuanensis]QEY60961.1 LysR family transcriptional regulator [Pseudomonas lalkuanensis]UCO98697.1 LysR family transcriptional regulator [Pseudomonas lalkuanensis]
MNLFQLRAFDAVVREGSFTRAAERLCISQPAVTGHVKALEEHYQVQLLRRTARQVEPTELGRCLAAISHQLFALADRAEDLLDSSQALTSGRLDLAADSPHLVMPLLARMRERYPGVRINLRLGNTQETLTALHGERVDLALVSDIAPRAGLHLLPLGEARLCLLLPAAHPWIGSREDVALHELRGEVLLQREPGSLTRRTFERACASQELELPADLELNSREAVIEAVAAGIGVSVIYGQEAPKDPRVKVLPLKGEGLVSRHFLACQQRHAELRVVKAFFEVAGDVGYPSP